MSSTKPSNSSLSKADIQMLVATNDPSISFVKPTSVRSKCWTNYSQVHHQNVALDYVICLECKAVLKWTSENGTRVMNHHKCIKSKSLSSTPTRQRTISSYCQQPSLSKECSSIKKRILDACVEYCALDGRSFESVAGTGFINLAKQLVCAGAILGTSIGADELLPHPTTVSIEL